MFQYFAGIYQRAVEDSGKSYHLSLHLNNNIDLEFVNRICNHAAGLIEAGISTLSPWHTTYCDFELSEIGNGVGALTVNQIRRKVLSQPGDPLYHEFVNIEDIVPMAESRRRLSSLYISGRRGKELDWVIRNAVTGSLKEARTTQPLIIAVHLYQEIDFREYQNRPAVKQELIPWTNRFFEEWPNVAMIFVSSNHELYSPRLVGSGQVVVKHMRHGWVLESPAWDYSEVAGLGI